MAPRFVNPHFLPDLSTLVSRKDIYVDHDDAECDEETHNSDPQLIEQLNNLTRILWEPLEELRSKCRKIQVESRLAVEEEDKPIPFRLVSSSGPPHPILLHPKPPRPPITREPETEDNETQAALRIERAQAAAVNASHILRESLVSTPQLYGDARKLIRVMAALPATPPATMIVEYDKPSRSTRPPVPVTLLDRHPYNHGPFLRAEPSVRSMHCPLIQASLSLSDIPTPTTKRKRRRGNMSRKERPSPAFWRPNPAVRGKSLGYAMGFPCSLEALRTGNSSAKVYQRDTMRHCRLSP